MSDSIEKPPVLVLVVEDEVIIAADLELRLTALGYDVCGPALSAEEALLLAETRRPDLVLMDIVIRGDMDGIEAAALIRERWGIPVVFNTAYADADRLERAKLSYPFGYILKPYRDRDLRITLEMALYVGRVDEERRRAEEALRESEDKYRRLFEMESDALVLIDNGSGRILEANEAASAIYGYGREELLSKKNTDLSAEPTETGKATRGAQTLVPLRWHRKRDGTVFPVEITGSHFEWRGRGVHIAAIRDISERLRAERDLRENEEKYRGLVEYSLQGLVIAQDDPLRLSFVSSPMMNIIGYSAEEMESFDPARLAELIHPEDRERFFINFRARLAGEEVSPRGEYRFIHRSGETRWAEIYSSKIEYQGGSATQTVFLDVTERKRAEEALREREFIYRHLFENGKDGVLILSLDENALPDRILEANQVVCQRLGYEREELLALSPMIILAPEEREATRARGRMVMEKGWAIFETEQVTRDGRRVPVESSASLFMHEGRPTVLSITRDVTERKRAEKALRDAEARWRFALEGARDGVWDWNRQTGEVFFSQQWKAMLGYVDPEIENRLEEWDRRVHPEDRERCYQDLDRHFRGETPVYQNEHRLLCKNGEYKWILDRGRVVERDRNGEALRVIGTHTDISEPKRMEAALRESEEKYRIIFNNEIYAICIFELERYRLLDVNEAYARLYGYRREELLSGMTVLDVTDEDEATMAAIKDILHGGTTFIPIRRHKKKDGTKLYVEIVAGPYTWSGRRVMFSLTHDITSRTRAEADRERLIGELQAAMGEVKTLRGLIPVCASCKKIRDDQGYWEQMEKYIMDRSDALFTHGLCPDCARRLYPEIYDE
ncbi:MAG: PAS domain S-box protein [Proteobacteria bacterium]|nr:PAS domain S-box protein [Pseudomonadota bacterium]